MGRGPVEGWSPSIITLSPCSFTPRKRCPTIWWTTTFFVMSRILPGPHPDG